MTRRDLLKHFGTMTAAAIALPMVDVDRLIWTPRPIITVPALTGDVFRYEFVASTLFAEGCTWTVVDEVVVPVNYAMANPVERALSEARLAAIIRNAEQQGQWIVTSREHR